MEVIFEHLDGKSAGRPILERECHFARCLGPFQGTLESDQIVVR